MLLRFRARNHLSLRDTEEISLVASSLDDDGSGLIACDAIGEKLLPAVVIYGANASGKSNLVGAIDSVRDDILFSHRKGEPGGGVPRSPFVLDSAVKASPTIFDIDFVLDGVRYHFGYESTDNAFIREWLYAYPNGRRQTLYQRTGQDFEFGRALKGRNRLIADATRDNSLFLSAAAQMNHGELSQVAGFFRPLRAIGAEVTRRLLVGDTSQKAVDHRIIDFLKKIGTGIDNILIVEQESSEQEKRFRAAIIESLDDELKAKLASSLDENVFSYKMVHRGRDGNEVPFEIEQESAGTRRLLHVLTPIFHALDTGTPVIIDELNAHLHTQACEALLALFCSPVTNPKGAQLIATTHDTNLLRSPYLRRDQVWFAEKDREGATHLYPLTDIRTRKDDNIEKGYLQGRYGAVPFAGPVSHLIGTR